MTVLRIPFNRPGAAGNESEHVKRALESGHLSGDGAFTRQCQDFLSESHAGARALLTTSCTHALELSAMLLDIGPGDEVIVPSFTFVSVANAVVLRGARVVFADIRPDTLNIDESTLPGLLSSRTRAIIVVHYAGVACEMDSIMRTAGERGVAVVEDNAHGIFGAYRGKTLGTLGTLSTLSFHETKNFVCGEGGALIINDHKLLARAEIIREKGTNRSQFFRGDVDKYTWLDIGSSYLPGELLAAFLWGQLEAADKIIERRRQQYQRYRQALSSWASAAGVELPFIPTYCDPSHHIFYLLTPSLEFRTALMASLRARGILSAFHYLPLHVSPMGQTFGGTRGQCPVTESVSDRLVRLPLFHTLTDEEQDTVIDAVLSFPGQS